MKVKQAKLGQSIKGETSNILTDANYDMTFDKGMLEVVKKHNPKNVGPFIVFPANLAYIEVEQEEAGLPTEKHQAKTGKGK